MIAKLGLPSEVDGRVWHYQFVGQSPHSHRHAELELNLITGGRASYLLGDRRYELHRRDLVWLFSGQDHVLLDQSPDYSMWILVFKPSLVQRLSTQPENQILRESNPSGDFCRRLSDSQYARLESLYKEIDMAQADLDRYNSGLGYALNLSWAAHSASSTISPFSGVHPCVEQAALILRDHSAEISLPQIAQKVGMSQSRLSRLFKEQTGLPLSEFRNRCRIERFCSIYEANRDNLQEAALKAGFGSYPQFHRVFKAQMGYSPGQFRKEG